MKLSVAIIAKNEANSIVRCLESVKGADEIIVVDTGSEDNTVEIAKRYGAKVFTDYKWNDNFAEARNHARSKCTGDWIFTIDCDNRLVEGTDAIREAVKLAEADGEKTISIRVLFENGGKFSHWLPYLYKNDPEIYWKGAVHNHLTRDDKRESNISISCWRSDSHDKDPDRSFRILKNECDAHPELVREKYYLGREYYNRREFETALEWFHKYLEVATWMPEMADAHLIMAYCLWNLNRGDEARAAACTAILLNTHFKEAIVFLAHISGPINRERWLEFAENAENINVLFVREKPEWQAEDYDQQFSECADMTRYHEIQQEIGKIVGDAEVLDIGCGPGALQKYVPNYSGFDFSPVAVKLANHPRVWVGSAYDKANFNGADYYVCTEVLEHLDDMKVIANIPSGKKVIFSVPNFEDPSHVRVFGQATILIRYGGLFDFKRMTRFYWDGAWKKDAPPSRDYITLVEAVKR